MIYRIVGMFSGINVWRIVELKVIGEIKFGEWIDFGHKDTIYQLKFGWLKFGESRTTRQIRQTFPPPNIPAIRYLLFDRQERGAPQAQGKVTSSEQVTIQRETEKT